MWKIVGAGVTQRDRSPRAPGRALIADATVLSSHVDLVDWRESEVQVEVCDECGTPGCCSGDYVALRRADRYLLWAPCTRMRAGIESHPSYAPPYFVHTRGTPMFEATHWDALRPQLGRDVPAASEVEPLRWGEAWLIAQLEATRELLGRPGDSPGPDLHELCIATDPFVDPDELARLADRRTWGFDDDALVQLLPAGEAELLTMYLEGHPSSACVLARHQQRWALHLRSGHLLVPHR